MTEPQGKTFTNYPFFSLTITRTGYSTKCFSSICNQKIKLSLCIVKCEAIDIVSLSQPLKHIM